MARSCHRSFGMPRKYRTSSVRHIPHDRLKRSIILSDPLSVSKKRDGCCSLVKTRPMGGTCLRKPTRPEKKECPIIDSVSLYYSGGGVLFRKNRPSLGVCFCCRLSTRLPCWQHSYSSLLSFSCTLAMCCLSSIGQFASPTYEVVRTVIPNLLPTGISCVFSCFFSSSRPKPS